jgi:hypothetical protein
MNATETTTEIVKFATGTTYYTRSIGDHNCIWRFTILRRSASSVWILDSDEGQPKVVRRKVSVYSGRETFSPFGQYSMSPTVSADRIADGIKDQRDW